MGDRLHLLQTIDGENKDKRKRMTWSLQSWEMAWVIKKTYLHTENC